MVQHELDDHPEPAPMRLFEEDLEVLERAAVGMDALVVGDVVAVVAQRRREEGEEPERRHAEALEIVEPLGETAEVAHAVPVAVLEGADAELVDDRVPVPERIGLGRGCGDGPLPSHRK